MYWSTRYSELDQLSLITKLQLNIQYECFWLVKPHKKVIEVYFHDFLLFAYTTHYKNNYKE